jgi:hypothetical protein
MEYTDNFDPNELNDLDDNVISNKRGENKLDDIKKMDRGYNKINRKIVRADGRLKNSKIDLYASGITGSQIRDAVSGSYFNNIVGTADEDLFFKVVLSSGECKSKNNSNTLFYLSPQQCMSHLNILISTEDISKWEIKCNLRQKQINETLNKKRKFASSVIH